MEIRRFQSNIASHSAEIIGENILLSIFVLPEYQGKESVNKLSKRLNRMNIL